MLLALQRWLAKLRQAPTIAVRLDGRSAQLSKAFDFALEQVASVAPLLGRKCTMEDARMTVKASHTQCGPVARAAESWLLSQGVGGTEFYSLRGHYVLLDRATGLLHDLEAPDGRRSKEDLPIWSRERELHRLTQAENSPSLTEVGKVFERYASGWLKRREELLAFAPEKPPANNRNQGIKNV